MSEALVRRWFQQVWNERRPEAIDAMFAEEGLAHGLPGEPRGPEGFRAFRDRFVALFPDIHISVEDVIEAAPDATGTVATAARFTVRGTHAPTGRPGAFECMCFSRWRGGKIVDAWNVCDFFGLQQQLGASPF